MQQTDTATTEPAKAAPAKGTKPKPLMVYDLALNIAKITRHIVPLAGITAAEIAVLKAMHGNDSVEGKIEDGIQSKTNPRFAAAEIGYLREKYGAAIVRHVFGAGFNNAIPEALEDLPAEIAPFVRKDEAEAA